MTVRFDRPSQRDIAQATAVVWGVMLEDLMGARRTKALAEARQAAYWLAKTITECSYPQVARHYGRDHTTVLHGVQLTFARMLADPAFARRMRVARGLAWSLVERRVSDVMRRDGDVAASVAIRTRLETPLHARPD